MSQTSRSISSYLKLNSTRANLLPAPAADVTSADEFQQNAPLSLPRFACAEEELSKFTAKPSEFSQEDEKARSLNI